MSFSQANQSGLFKLLAVSCQAISIILMTTLLWPIMIRNAMSAADSATRDMSITNAAMGLVCCVLMLALYIVSGFWLITTGINT